MKFSFTWNVANLTIKCASVLEKSGEARRESQPGDHTYGRAIILMKYLVSYHRVRMAHPIFRFTPPAAAASP